MVENEVLDHLRVIQTRVYTMVLSMTDASDFVTVTSRWEDLRSKI